jgi:hypothetical protein
MLEPEHSYLFSMFPSSFPAVLPIFKLFFIGYFVGRLCAASSTQPGISWSVLCWFGMPLDANGSKQDGHSTFIAAALLLKFHHAQN